MTDESAEYRYYAELSRPADGGPAPDERVDLEAWGRLLDAPRVFAPGGRYAIVSEHFETAAPVDHLLEIGGGSGVYVAYMQRFAHHCHGADIHLQRHLRDDAMAPLSFLEFNANHPFPLEPGSFDVVVAMMVLEHVFGSFHFCAEVSRILRPSGINVPLVTAIGHRLAFGMGRLPVTSEKAWFDKRVWDGAHLHDFTLPLLERLLGFYGLQVDRVRGVGRWHRWKTRLPTLLAKEISLRARKGP